MLTLLLLRHAKSSWDDPSLDDFERPLNKRGTIAAQRIGAYLAEEHLIPDLVLCSTAVRTRATLTLVINAMRATTPSVQFRDDLYLADAGTLLDIVRATEAKVKTLLVLGHNPGLHSLALELTGHGPRPLIAELAMQYPTAALTRLTFDEKSWSAIRGAGGTLEAFVLPRRLS
ncbi:MAG: histidine phosphatase family protein [Hyphomicrobiaceae bacterium]|nr:histidine phosphatase family protein [Hyphomicrobiaceae bacterium]